MDVTYWLMDGTECVGSVRATRGANRQEVMERALEQHQRVPLCAPVAPYEHAHRIVWARVFLYPDGNPGEPAGKTEVL